MNGDEAQERERRRIWTVAVRVVDGAIRARVIGQLQASGETELAVEDEPDAPPRAARGRSFALNSCGTSDKSHTCFSFD